MKGKIHKHQQSELSRDNDITTPLDGWPVEEGDTPQKLRDGLARKTDTEEKSKRILNLIIKAETQQPLFDEGDTDEL